MQAANEFEDSSQADDLDRLLYQMPGELPQSDLAARICHQLSGRQRRALGMRLGLSFLLAVFETAIAKMRVFRVPNFLGAALMLGLLGVLLLFVSQGM